MVQEHFTLTLQKKMYFPNLNNIILSVLLATLLTYPVLGINKNGIFASIILFILFFILFNSLTNENLSNELPSYLYPSPPHMGLDGISLNAYVSGSERNLNNKLGYN